MKVIMSILNGQPPQLNKHEKWDQLFRDFVNSCLQKDPSKRLPIAEIFKVHKKFFAKAKDNKFLKESFIGDLKEVHLRNDQNLQALGKEYLEHKKKTKVKVVNADDVWDFDSGDYSSTVKK